MTSSELSIILEFSKNFLINSLDPRNHQTMGIGDDGVYSYAPDKVSGSASVVWRSRSREAMRAVDIMTMDDVAIQISSQMASWTTVENYEIYAGYGNDYLPQLFLSYQD